MCVRFAVAMEAAEVLAIKYEHQDYLPVGNAPLPFRKVASSLTFALCLTRFPCVRSPRSSHSPLALLIPA
jgi:hypothetical protein